METATPARGCFWCLEAVFREVPGVEKVVPGYTGGTAQSPSYHDVCTGETGHAEAVQIAFDPSRVTFRTVLEIFFSVHDPTTLNRQGADEGTQYRSAIYYHNEEQKRTAVQVINELNKSRVFRSPVITELAPLGEFYTAEDYHHRYFERNPQQPYCRMVIAPKLARYRNRWLGHRSKSGS